MAERTPVPEIYAFECRVRGTDWMRVVNAPNAGKARYLYWLDVSDPWPGVRLIDIRVRKAGPPVSSDMLQHVNKLRGCFYAAGDHVTLPDGRIGVIAGAGSGGAYYELWVDGKHMWAHPCDFATVPPGKEGA